MHIIGMILFLLYGLAQIVVGAAGIDFYFGGFWSGLAIFGAIFLRITLPITIGAFFGAVEVLNWHWALAVLFAAPGLIFIVPGMIALTLERFRK